ncbi:uncharacterized protein ACN427_004624 isoform 1-T1 [Glossina fuscipes fuscipes]
MPSQERVNVIRSHSAVIDCKIDFRQILVEDLEFGNFTITLYLRVSKIQLQAIDAHWYRFENISHQQGVLKNHRTCGNAAAGLAFDPSDSGQTALLGSEVEGAAKIEQTSKRMKRLYNFEPQFSQCYSFIHSRYWLHDLARRTTLDTSM